MVREGRLVYHYNWFDVERYEVISDAPLPSGKIEVSMDFVPEGATPGSPAAVTLTVNGSPAGQGRVEKQVPARFSLETLDVGLDTLSPVAKNYPVAHYPFTGTIERIDIDFPHGGSTHSPEEHKRLTLALD